MAMMPDEFRNSIRKDEPQEGLPTLLQVLWWDAKGYWDRAHEIAQNIESQDAAWVHAYLHRKEGDNSNAAFWYRQAGRPYCMTEFEDEWHDIVHHLLSA